MSWFLVFVLGWFSISLLGAIGLIVGMRFGWIAVQEEKDDEK